MTIPDTSHTLEHDDTTSKAIPLPYGPIIALSLGRIAEGLLYSVIFPYVNQLVSELGVPEEDVGRWSAAAVSGFLACLTRSHQAEQSQPGAECKGNGEC